MERLYGLRRALAIYRTVFGQSRLEDLITYLLAQIPEEEQAVIVGELEIDLSPGSGIHCGRDHGTLEEIDRAHTKSAATRSGKTSGVAAV